jgi:dolichyl-phosphate beta-glucosyltransferase
LNNLQKIVFVVPCYNEANRLKSDLFLQFCQSHSNIHFCFVDDGSKDGTIEVLKAMQQANNIQISYLQLPHNQGKAEAVRQGILHSHSLDLFAYTGYLDADLATPLSEIPYFLQIIHQSPENLLIAGSRISRMGAEIDRYWFRHYFGRVFATVVSIMLNLRFYDTQCGAKLLKSEIINDIFSEGFISPWLFDVELIFRILKLKTYKNSQKLIYELPLREWKEQKESKIKFSDLLKIPIELFKIYRKYKG